MPEQDYYSVAVGNETVFRNILRDLKANSRKRPGGCYIPIDLETEAPLDQIFQRYSEGERSGKFTILQFSRPTPESAIFAFEDVAPLSGGGADLEYEVNKDSSVKYKRPIFTSMSLI